MNTSELTKAEKEQKKVISVYKLDTSNDEKGKTLWETLTNHFAKKEKKLYTNFCKKYDSRAFSFSKKQNISWGAFINDILQDKLYFQEGYDYGLLILVKEKDSDDTIFAITFGLIGYIEIKNYIDQSFGLELLSRIVEPNENIFTASKEQNLIGTVKGQLSIYNQLYSHSDLEDFGKIFQELNIKINKDILKDFGIESEKKFKSCCAKSSFQIKTAISPQAIEKYIDGCFAILKSDKKINLNGATKLEKKKAKDKKIYREITDNAIKNLWLDISNDADYDLCHKEFDDYIKAEKYKFQYGRKKSTDIQIDTTLKDLINEYKITEDSFEKFVKNGKVCSYNDDSSSLPLTEGKLWDHLFIEHEEESKKYFILNGDIFKIEKSLINYLDNKIGNYKNKGLFIEDSKLLTWGKNKSEGDYNDQYNTAAYKNSFIEIHPCIYFNNTEICDLIRYDEENNLYLYFVKKGFGGTIRDLCYQIYTSAKLIESDINTDCKYLKEFHSKITGTKSKYKDRINLSEEDFINLFKRDLKYVFVFCDDAKSQRKLREAPEQFESNVAKFALIDLEKKMNNIGKGALKICQISYE